MKSIKLITPYFSENRTIIIIGLFCLIVVDFLQLYVPRILKWAIDDLSAFKADPKRLLTYALYIVACAVLIGVFRFLWRRCLIGLSRKVEEGLRNRFFLHIQTLSASYFDNARTGDLMAHATNDIMHIRMAAGMGIVALTDAVVLGTAAIGFMLYINKTLTLFVLIPMPFVILSSRFFGRKMHLLYRNVQASFSNLTEVARERFSGIRIIKAYTEEKASVAKFADISKDYIVKNLALTRVAGSFFPMMVLFTNLSLAIVIYLGGRQTINLTITPGDFVAFLSYLGLLTWPMMAMGWVINLIQRGRASLNRLDNIFQTKPEIIDPPDAKPLEKVRGDIVFDNVSFLYPSSKSFALSGIELNIGHGKILGIIGPPGSGKTTLANLIPRITDVSDGQILIDGTDIRKSGISDLRSNISFVPQEPFLFSGTILENITFKNERTDDDRLIRAAKEADVYDTIQSFSSGFNTIAGEKGVILSGGQKQRIALARALFHDSSILILDDPISQVDTETGYKIINTIKAKRGSKTIIIISHRLSAVQYADQIITLREGRIVESGTHDQLMEKNKFYAKTFRLQQIEKEFNAV